MKRKRFMLLSVLAVTAGILAYLLFPLAGKEHAIVFDESMIEAKRRFLTGERRRFEEEGGDDERPNIVLILADDLGKTDITAYGVPYNRGGNAVPTPAIDSIGAGGVLFTDAYCPAPICGPSRAGMLTGRMQNRFGMEYQPHDRYPRNRLEYLVFRYFIDLGSWRPVRLDSYPRREDILRQMLPPGEITIAELLKARGYETAVIGKWHLGISEEAAPSAYGFDYHYGFYEAFTLYAPVDDPDIVNHPHDTFQSKHIWSIGRSGAAAIRRNGTVIEENGYLTERIADESVEFIEANAGSPFFLYAAFSAPHTPFQATREYYDLFPDAPDRNHRVYYAMIAALDDAVGRILQALRDAGIENETLVLFASDNGGAAYTGATDNAPLRGGKFSQFEGGLNVPYFVKWPGKVRGGSVYREPVSLTDFFTTAAAAAGAVLPEDRPYDGSDLIPLVTGEKSGQPHSALYWRGGPNLAIRKGDWKLIVDERDGRELLYRLSDDREERFDLSDSRPDIVKSLREELDSWSGSLPAPLWPPVMDYRFTIDGEEFQVRI